MLLANIFDRDLDVAMVLIKFTEAIEILLQLLIIEPSRFIEDRDERLGLCLHLVAQRTFAEVGVALEPHRTDRAFLAFGDGVNGACGSACLIYLKSELDVHTGKTLSLVEIDDVLASFFQRLFFRGTRHLELDVSTDLFRLNTFGAIDLDFRHEHPGSDNHHYLHSICLRFPVHAHVLDRARLVKVSDIIFDCRFRIRRSHSRAQVGENPLAAHSFGSDVLNLDRLDDGTFLPANI